MTDTVWLITEFTGEDDPIMVYEDMADAIEWCARENRALVTAHQLRRFDYRPIQIQREEKHVGI